MLDRGLLPDFSAAVIAETDAITTAASDGGPSVRDLRRLLWASIDNDDSRDLDQLTVAVPSADGAVNILVAVADVDALVRKGSATSQARTPSTVPTAMIGTAAVPSVGAMGLPNREVYMAQVSPTPRPVLVPP